jgi:hypothetical protein
MNPDVVNRLKASTPKNEISIEDLTKQILLSTISSPPTPSPHSTNTRDFNPRPTKRPHLSQDDRPKPLEPELHDLDISDEELKAISGSNSRTSLLPTIHEALDEETHSLQQTDSDQMEFHYTSPIDNSYEMRRKFLKRTSSEVNCSNSREEDLVHLNTPVLSLKKLYKARGLVELPKFASLKLRVPQQSHLIRPIPICAVQSYQQRQSQSFKQVGELPQPPDHISIQQDPPQHALPSKPFVFV